MKVSARSRYGSPRAPPVSHKVAADTYGNGSGGECTLERCVPGIARRLDEADPGSMRFEPTDHRPVKGISKSDSSRGEQDEFNRDNAFFRRIVCLGLPLASSHERHIARIW
jgi:hypothetical protein